MIDGCNVGVIISGAILLAASVFGVLNGIAPQQRLVSDLLSRYDKKVRPGRFEDRPVVVTFSMDLYQMIEVNEPQQYVMLNTWIIERWTDDLLYWDPSDYDNITELLLPCDSIWLPDTTLYNTLVMKDDDTRRLLNAKLTSNRQRQAVNIDMLYPTIYKFSCQLNLLYFPFDKQHCVMLFGSWTYDNLGIDYFPHSNLIGTAHYLENEGWTIMSSSSIRREIKYACCPNNYTNLELTLNLKRKPLFYLVNLVIPTCIITLISIIGFFMPSSANGEREEKISLGITTLLSMSILMLMVSDQMPTTSTAIPLIGWFYLSMILLISGGTIMSSVIIGVQKMGQLGVRLSPSIVSILRILSRFELIPIPVHLTNTTIDAVIDVNSNRRTARSRSFRDLVQSRRIRLRNATNGVLDDTDTAGPSNYKKRRQGLDINEAKQKRIFAIREYDWLAAIFERTAFALFLIMFACLSIGINALGFVSWIDPTI